MNTSSTVTSETPGERKVLANVGLLPFVLVFLEVNLPTLGRIPYVSANEVFFSDPALNLVSGEGLRRSIPFFLHPCIFGPGILPGRRHFRLASCRVRASPDASLEHHHCDRFGGRCYIIHRHL